MNRFVFIMPAFNAEKTIVRSITSVLFQTYSNWKIIIRDDMSTDGTAEQIEILRNSIPNGKEKISYIMMNILMMIDLILKMII